jgi:hypothetical protein
MLTSRTSRHSFGPPYANANGSTSRLGLEIICAWSFSTRRNGRVGHKVGDGSEDRVRMHRQRSGLGSANGLDQSQSRSPVQHPSENGPEATFAMRDHDRDYSSFHRFRLLKLHQKPIIKLNIQYHCQRQFKMTAVRLAWQHRRRLQYFSVKSYQAH